MSNFANPKAVARAGAKTRRAAAARGRPDAGSCLVQHWPALGVRRGLAGFYLPIQTEIDPRPLMTAMADAGHDLALPCIQGPGKPLTFRAYRIGDNLVQGPYGTHEPAKTQNIVQPDILFVPLLAYSNTGDRLGYGGGFYDRTLKNLRAKKSVFACGLAYSGQCVLDSMTFPVDKHDQKLNAVLTEQGSKDFR